MNKTRLDRLKKISVELRELIYAKDTKDKEDHFRDMTYWVGQFEVELEQEEQGEKMNQKDKDKILRDVRIIGPQGRSDLLYFLFGYLDKRPGEFWEGCAFFFHIDIDPYSYT